MPCIPVVLHSTSVVFLVSLDPLLRFFLHLLDVLDMVDVLIEGSDDLDEEIGFSLNEDMITQTFPFSAVVPAALEARNVLLLQSENGTGTDFFGFICHLYQWSENGIIFTHFS